MQRATLLILAACLCAPAFAPAYPVKRIEVVAAGDAAKNYVHQKKGGAHVLYVESNRIFQNKILGATALGVDDFVPLARLVTEYRVWVVRADAPQHGARCARSGTNASAS